MTALRVLVVDDSELSRALLKGLLQADGDIVVVAEAADGEAALRLVPGCRPQLVTMDLGLPGLSGLDVIERIMARWPTPILVVTGQPVGPVSDLAFCAVQRGALDLVAKPDAGDPDAGAALRAQVRQLARVPVLRHPGGATLAPALTPPRGLVGLGPAPEGAPVIGIGASAGGPAAVVGVLADLPPDFPGSVALVQHLPHGFVGAFAEFLRHGVHLAVEVVPDEAALRPGTVFLPRDDRHLVVCPGGVVRAADEPPVGPYRPSVTRLFASLAQACGAAAVGVVLSGIGDDGAAGLAEMRACGALTIAQSEASALVYGMPRAAMERGAAARALDVAAIAAVLGRLGQAARRPGAERRP